MALNFHYVKHFIPRIKINGRFREFLENIGTRLLIMAKFRDEILIHPVFPYLLVIFLQVVVNHS